MPCFLVRGCERTLSLQKGRPRPHASRVSLVPLRLPGTKANETLRAEGYSRQYSVYTSEPYARVRSCARLRLAVAARECQQPLVAHRHDAALSNRRGLRGLTQCLSDELARAAGRLNRCDIADRRGVQDVSAKLIPGRSQIVDSKAACHERAERVERRDVRVVVLLRGLRRFGGTSRRSSRGTQRRAEADEGARLESNFGDAAVAHPYWYSIGTPGRSR